MFKWKKRGLIFDIISYKDRPEWMFNFAQGQNVLEFDNFLRVYFCCREKPNTNGQTVSRVAYVDLDKNDLSHILKISNKPVLELGGLGEFDEFGTYPFSVIRDNNKIYGYYGGVTRCESIPFNTAIGCCVSNDNGESFKKIGKGPVLSYSLYEPFNIGSPKIRKFNDKWFLTYVSGVKWVQGDTRPEVCYKLRLAVSQDGVNWEKYNKNIIEDKLGEDEAQACGDIIYKNGKYHMFFCYRKNLDFRKNPNNTYRIGYAFSNDMENWIRDDDRAGIDISSNNSDWDSEMVAYPNVFELNNKIYMLYLGNEVGKYGFGLAELEGDLY